MRKILGTLLFIIGLPILFAGLIQIFTPGDTGIDITITIIMGILPTFFGFKLLRAHKRMKNNKIRYENNYHEQEQKIKHDYQDISEINDENIIYYVLDVETADENNESICQIGIVGFNNSGLVKSWGSLINPESSFSESNISIHGITEKDVKKSPKFIDIHNYLKIIEGKTVIQHTGFDKSSINKACKKYNIELLDYKWLDSALIAKRTWQDVSKKGYGLGDLSKKLNFDFLHHDAVEDAIVTGKIVQKALEVTNTTIDDWFNLVKKPLSYFYGSKSNKKSPNSSQNKRIKDPKQILHSNSNFSQEKIKSMTDTEAWEHVYQIKKNKSTKKRIHICFTGFNTDQKDILMDLAYSNNFHVVGSVTKNLQFLICGSNAGPSKIEKAIAQGVKMLNENQFMNLIESGELPY